MKPALESLPVEPEKLKPMLHEKIEHMNGHQLSLLSRILLQMEAEELAERIGNAFDEDHAEGKTRRIAELVRTFRVERPY